jgi:hypothetical protein
MMQFIVWILVLTIMTPPIMAQKNPSSEIIGVWQTSCYLPSRVRKGYIVDKLTFTKQGTFKRELQRFADASCAKSTLSELQEMEGRYALKGTVPKLGAGAHHLDLVVLRLDTTAVSEAVAQEFIRTRYCNIAQWKRGLRRSILGQPCFDLQPLKAGGMVFDIVKVESDKLFLGLKSFLADGSSPKKRPESFGSIPFGKISEESAAH